MVWVNFAVFHVQAHALFEESRQKAISVVDGFEFLEKGVTCGQSRFTDDCQEVFDSFIFDFRAPASYHIIEVASEEQRVVLQSHSIVDVLSDPMSFADVTLIKATSYNRNQTFVDGESVHVAYSMRTCNVPVTEGITDKVSLTVKSGSHSVCLTAPPGPHFIHNILTGGFSSISKEERVLFLTGVYEAARLRRLNGQTKEVPEFVVDARNKAMRTWLQLPTSVIHNLEEIRKTNEDRIVCLLAILMIEHLEGSCTNANVNLNFQVGKMLSETTFQFFMIYRNHLFDEPVGTVHVMVDYGIYNKANRWVDCYSKYMVHPGDLKVGRSASLMGRHLVLSRRNVPSLTVLDGGTRVFQFVGPRPGTFGEREFANALLSDSFLGLPKQKQIDVLSIVY